jgi:hypothetical protein
MHYTVIFDRPENVVMPRRGMYSLYATDQSAMEKIVADFEFSPFTGYSRATTYRPNMWQGRPVALTL